jgi:hypothetical protein
MDATVKAPKVAEAAHHDAWECLCFCVQYKSTLLALGLALPPVEEERSPIAGVQGWLTWTAVYPYAFCLFLDATLLLLVENIPLPHPPASV